MREIALDTETTGLNPKTGDRIVEIGAVEMFNHIPTGQVFHVYINPERDMPAEAFAVHGLSDEFLADKPVFSAVAEDFLAFVADARLVIHNATFDMGFINAELTLLGRPPIPMDGVVDTLAMARRRHPGSPASLDYLCSRFGIDNSKRVKHGALLDAELLAEVYLELIGGRQANLVLVDDKTPARAGGISRRSIEPRRKPLPPRLNASEIAAHLDFIKTLGKEPVWARYLADLDQAEQ